jgi:CheY-like chemotaxis protein
MQVLVVEDDLMLADCMAEALVGDGHVLCGVASTVAEAMAMARQLCPDVAILDMQLSSGERGSDVADQMHRSGDFVHTGILYVTGEAERVHREARVGHACLQKPYTFNALNAALAVVREIALDGNTSRAVPLGLELLHLAGNR